MADDYIIETRGLTKEFKGFLAVNDVDLKVRHGTIHALIGPNGAGKTTLLQPAHQVPEPTRGQHPLRRAGHHRATRRPTIARAGMVRSFQISAVFPHLTVLENVRVALQRTLGTSLPLLALRDEPRARSTSGRASC